MLAWNRLTVDLCWYEEDFEWRAGICSAKKNATSSGHPNVEFLSEFTYGRIVDRLTGLDLPTRKLPEPTMALMFRP